MSLESVLMHVILLFLPIFCLVRWIRRMPVGEDPWDSEISDEEVGGIDTPVCENCLTPVVNQGQHYCPNCGNATGEFTRYVPFVNIPFNYSLLATLWRRIKRKETSSTDVCVAVIVILAIAPIMLVVGVPFLIYGKLTEKPK